MPVVAVADMFGIAAAHTELRQLLAEHERASAASAGCRRYTFASTLAEPDHFVLVSEWDDEAAMDAHYASEEYAQFQFSLHGLLARPSTMTVYTVTGEVRPVASGPMDPRDAD
jgi:quinol monooxygenase YgiN